MQPPNGRPSPGDSTRRFALLPALVLLPGFALLTACGEETDLEAALCGPLAGEPDRSVEATL
ncbi:MAG: hypothetical protein ACI9U2_003533 [Bradymonadia bacterium]|jgi:hypothetical protein